MFKSKVVPKKLTNASRGAASIFLVIFSMLIISTVVLGFTSVILREQREASNNDLSVSAYDSALAGVEDAKRAIIRYNKGCGPAGTASASTCNTWRQALTKCNSNNVILYGTASGDFSERRISTASRASELELDQAYTCVKTSLNNPNYIGEVRDGEHEIFELRGEGAFSTVRISWFSQKDVQEGNEGRPASQLNRVNYPSTTASNTPLPYNNSNTWPANQPPVLRTQFFQTPSSFSLEEFDVDNPEAGLSNTNTVFMYPIRGSAAATNEGVLQEIAPRFYSDANPWAVLCAQTVTQADGYACTATLRLPGPMRGTQAQAYLALKPLYNKTDFKVELINDAGEIVNFMGVQPLVDSTGRANDIFRRVEARLQLSSDSGSSLAPTSAVETSGSFCKTFSVTDSDDGYGSGDCDPSR